MAVCLIRLGRDREAYDFVKWWVMTPTVFGQPAHPYTAMKGENIMEQSSIVLGSSRSLACAAFVLLLKLRLLMDLEALERSFEELPANLPQEVTDRICWHMVSDALSRKAIERKDEEGGHFLELLRAEANVKYIVKYIHNINKHLGPALARFARNGPEYARLNSDKTLDRPAKGASMEMVLALSVVGTTWVETPGPISAIELLCSNAYGGLSVVDEDSKF